MPEQVADVCDRCERTVIKDQDYDSPGMVEFVGEAPAYLLLMRELRLEEHTRPSFSFHGKLWCPACLILDLQEWLQVPA